MASDPRYALLLVGLGLRRLSVSPRAIPEVKTWIRERSAAELIELAQKCLQHATAKEVQQHLERAFESSILRSARREPVITETE